ncbi:MAG: hypothetical protein GY861_21275 [bacterium]|nr:hypothetical protein [bacterium]
MASIKKASDMLVKFPIRTIPKACGVHTGVPVAHPSNFLSFRNLILGISGKSDSYCYGIGTGAYYKLPISRKMSSIIKDNTGEEVDHLMVEILSVDQEQSQVSSGEVIIEFIPVDDRGASGGKNFEAAKCLRFAGDFGVDEVRWTKKLPLWGLRYSVEATDRDVIGFWNAYESENCGKPVYLIFSPMRQALRMAESQGDLPRPVKDWCRDDFIKYLPRYFRLSGASQASTQTGAYDLFNSGRSASWGAVMYNTSTGRLSVRRDDMVFDFITVPGSANDSCFIDSCSVSIYSGRKNIYVGLELHWFYTNTWMASLVFVTGSERRVVGSHSLNKFISYCNNSRKLTGNLSGWLVSKYVEFYSNLNGLLLLGLDESVRAIYETL